MVDQLLDNQPFLVLGFINGLSLVLAGLLMQIFPPKEINQLYGYRTKRSMANQSNWDIAQQYSSKLLVLFGLFIIVFGFLADRLFSGLDFSMKVFVSMFFLFLAIVCLILATEQQLKTNQKEKHEQKIRDKIRKKTPTSEH